MSRLLRSGRAAAWLGAAALLVVACNSDDATAPKRASAPSADVSPDDPSPPGGTLGPVPIPIAETNLGSGAVPWMGTGMTIPAFTSFVVKVSGDVTLAPNPMVATCWPDHQPPYGAEGSWGPLGDPYYHQLAVGIGFQYQLNGALGWIYGGIGGDGGSTAQSDTSILDKAVEVWVSRSGIYHEIGGGAPCPPQGLYLMSGSQTISVQILDGQELQVDPKVAIVKKGTKVQFTATADGQIVDQPAWYFVPKAGTENATTGCGGGENPCTLTVYNDGELHVRKVLKGRMRTAKAAVTIGTSFRLVADKPAIEKGETVTFTPYVDDEPGAAAHWVWRAQDGTEVLEPCAAIVDDKCQYAPQTSGSMLAFLSTTADGPKAEAAVTVNEKKNVVRITLQRDMMRFTTRISGQEKCADYTQISGQDLKVAVVDPATGERVPNQTVDLQLASLAPEFPGGPDYGGHYLEEHKGEKPTGELASTRVNTGASGETTVRYTASVMSGQYEVMGTSDGAEKGGDTISVGVALEEYFETPYDRLIGSTRRHKYNHFVTLASMSRLHVLTRWYHDAVNQSYNLELNDMSLEHGGKFDINGDWSTPHCDHLDGRGIDLRTETLPGKARDREKIEKQWLSENFYLRDGKELKLPYLYERNPPHLHLKTWPSDAVVVFPGSAARSTSSVSVLQALPTLAETQGTLRVKLTPTAFVATGNSLQLSYSAHNDEASSDSVDFIVVDAPVRPVEVTGAAPAEWWTGTAFADRQVAAWGFIGSHLPAGTSSPRLSFVAAGVPGIVKYWVLPVIAADTVMDVEDRGTLAGVTEAASDSGYTVGIVPTPSDNSPEAAVGRADALAADACALGWIDDAGVCNSLRVKIRNQSWDALMQDLDAQRGKHVNENAYVLLYATAQRLKQ